jgi:hypothetical protein
MNPVFPATSRSCGEYIDNYFSYSSDLLYKKDAQYFLSQQTRQYYPVLLRISREIEIVGATNQYGPFLQERGLGEGPHKPDAGAQQIRAPVRRTAKAYILNFQKKATFVSF